MHRAANKKTHQLQTPYLHWWRHLLHPVCCTVSSEHHGHMCPNDVHSFQLSLQHDHPPAAGEKTLFARPWNSLQLDFGLADREVIVSAHGQQIIKHHHAEHRCNHSYIVKSNIIVKFADDTAIVDLISNDDSLKNPIESWLNGWLECTVKIIWMVIRHK